MDKLKKEVKYIAVARGETRVVVTVSVSVLAEKHAYDHSFDLDGTPLEKLMAVLSIAPQEGPELMSEATTKCMLASMTKKVQRATDVATIANVIHQAAELPTSSSKAVKAFQKGFDNLAREKIISVAREKGSAA